MEWVLAISFLGFDFGVCWESSTFLAEADLLLGLEAEVASEARKKMSYVSI